MFTTAIDPIGAAKKWAAAIGLVLGLTLLIFSGLYIWSMKARLDRLEDFKVIATADIAAAETHRKGLETIHYEQQEAEDATEEALDRSPAYRDGYVPSSVADRLRNRKDAE